MRTLFFVGVLLSGYLITQGQEYKTKKVQRQVFTEIFQIEKKSKQKMGSYLKTHNLSNDTLVIGQYINDSIAGVWSYFDLGNKPYMKYDYSNDSCLWISELANKPDTFPARIRNNFGFAKLDRPPLYIGFRKELHILFSSGVKIPVPMMEKGEKVVYIASFIITKNGEIDEINTEKIENKQIRDDVLEMFKALKGKWLPGIYNGIQVDTKLYVIFDIGPVDLVTELQKKPYIINIGIKYFGVKTTRVTTREVTTKTVGAPGTNKFRANVPETIINR